MSFAVRACLELSTAFILAGALAVRGLKKKSLSKSGAVAAFCVGAITMSTGVEFGATLIFFYQSSSTLTKYGSAIKKKKELGFKEGGQRDAIQVLSNSLIATVLAALILILRLDKLTQFLELLSIDLGSQTAISQLFNANKLQILQSCLIHAFIAHYACATGDTWASEVGILSNSKPILITQPWREVPPGTNGGITFLGCAMSFLGGLAIGIFYSFIHALKYSQFQPSFVFIGVFGGVFGSFVDSLLGATLQASYIHKEKNIIVNEQALQSVQKHNIQKKTGINFLTNSQVNQLSLLVTTVLALFLRYHEIAQF